jgi:Amidohydrolase family
VCDNPHQADFAMRLSPAFFALMCGLVLGSVPARPQAESVTPPVPLVLTGGTVVDVTNWGQSAHDISNAIVIIRDGRITDVGLPSAVPIPKGARVIDCTGKFLIPGLVDGYAGMNSQAQANANLYMGVTTVVARADYQHGFIDFNAQPSPHIYPIDSIGVTDNWSLLARRPEWVSKLREGAHPVELSPEDTATQIADSAQLGTRVLLLTAHLTAANSQWIISRAHELGLVTYGDFVATPYRVGVEAGVDALPFMDHYILGVIPDELQRPLVDDPDGSSANTAYDYAERIPPTDLHLRNYAKFLAAHHAALLPAFSLYYVELPNHRNLWLEPAASLLDPERMFHPTDRATGEMMYPLPPWAHRLPATGQRWMEENLQKKAAQSAMRLWRINETIFSAFPHYLAASGADSMGTMPGISLHTELEMLVRLGLTPREALAAATNNYSLQFGWNELGLIAPGRRADILVVDGDPAANIWNARRISAIIFNGEPLDRNALLHLKR